MWSLYLYLNLRYIILELSFSRPLHMLIISLLTWYNVRILIAHSNSIISI